MKYALLIFNILMAIWFFSVEPSGRLPELVSFVFIIFWILANFFIILAFALFGRLTKKQDILQDKSTKEFMESQNKAKKIHRSAIFFKNYADKVECSDEEVLEKVRTGELKNTNINGYIFIFEDF